MVDQLDKDKYLPLIRANYSGDSLIAIANAGRKQVDVTIEYRGSSFSASGAGEAFSQQFSIPVHAAAFVDLSERGRGSRPSPALPRGNAPNGGLIGGAVIRASGPVLAVVQDEQLRDGQVDSVSAYNAFGSGDLGSEFSVTTVRKMWGYQSTSLIAYNPGYDSIEVSADLYDDAGAPAGQIRTQIPAQSSARLALAEAATFPAGFGRAYVRGSGPFAALEYDERDDRGDPLQTSTTAYLRTIEDSHVSGSARFSEQGTTVLVDLQITGTWPGASYSAAIVAGDCDGALQVAHPLIAPAEGKSTTILRNLTIGELTTQAHSVLIKVAGFPGRPAREVACGFIEPVPGAEVVDTALSWPVRMAVGAPIIQPTPTQPTITSTATSSSPATATPSATAMVTRSRAYLPLAYRQP